MKTDIHPKYNTKANIKCACGNEMKIGSTVDETQVELCSNCHPFYTGQQKLVDTARRVEKFQEKMAKKAVISETRTGKKAKREKRAAKKEEKKAA